jgi:HNH endonuclease
MNKPQLSFLSVLFEEVQETPKPPRIIPRPPPLEVKPVIQEAVKAGRKKRQTTKAMKEAVEKTPYCVRCFKTKYLHAHHIVAIADGGPDTLENIDVLCGQCHREWHQSAEGMIDYGEFLLSPPTAVMTQIMARAGFGEVDMGSVHACWNLYQMFRVHELTGDTFPALRFAGDQTFTDFLPIMQEGLGRAGMAEKAA